MKKILIVDDDLDLIAGTQAILEASDYEVYSAVNKDEGIKAIKKHKPDLVILDVNMTTEQEGFEMNLELNSNPEFKDIPVLMQTGIEIMTTNLRVADMIREIRKDPQMKETKTLLIKGADDATGVDYLSKDGMSIFFPVSGFLSKPVEAEDLISAVEKILK